MAADHVDVERAHELAERLHDFLDRHDREQHDVGEVCDGARVGIIAYLCHSIGVHGADNFHVRFFARVAAEVESYDEQHDRLHEHKSENGQ